MQSPDERRENAFRAGKSRARERQTDPWGWFILVPRMARNRRAGGESAAELKAVAAAVMMIAAVCPRSAAPSCP